jgi:hypothetical protein
MAIDIKPGGFPNAINLGSNGVLPVAVLTTTHFDAADFSLVDLSRIRFGDMGVTARVSPLRAALEDVDRDGDPDLVLHFSIPQIRNVGALLGSSTGAELTGFTITGRLIRGADSVRIVGAPGHGGVLLGPIGPSFDMMQPPPVGGGGFDFAGAYAGLALSGNRFTAGYSEVRTGAVACSPEESRDNSAYIADPRGDHQHFRPEFLSGYSTSHQGRFGYGIVDLEKNGATRFGDLDRASFFLEDGIEGSNR